MRRSFIFLILLLVIYQAKLAAQGNCAFTVSSSSGCPPLSVIFTDQSTGSPTGYEWQLDNGAPITSQNASANYATPGIRNIMHVTFYGTVSDTEYFQIRVFLPPTVNFMSPDNSGCNNPCHLVHFTNQTIPGESAVQAANYVWDFGDNSLPEPGYNATHCYDSIGNYNVTLIALDDNGCQVSKIMPNFVVIGPSPVASVAANPTQSCASSQLVNFTGTGSSPNGVVTYGWNFGNGTSSQQNPAQTFTCGVYNPVLTVTDPMGCNATATIQIDVPCLDAGFTAATTNGCAGIPVQFTDASNYASGWSWTFGDGGTSTQQNPAYTYSAPGTYTVTLTATYAGCTDTETQTAYITITDPVIFTFSADDYSNCTAPFTVNFTSHAPPGSTYTWNFGDGGSSTVANPTYTYTGTGTFTVTLGIPNPTGCVNTQTLSSPVSVGALQANFTVDETNGCTPLTVQFTNTTTSNVAITTYGWQFGDGGTSTTQNPVYTYTTGGQYIPILTVVDADGCTSTYTYPGTIDVGTTLVPDFSALPLIQCVNQDVVFSNLTPGTTPTTEYLWEFHQGTSTDRDPVHQYSDTGIYDVTLTVINQGCSATVTKTNYIRIVEPRADFTFNFNCTNPTTVTFTDASQGADTWTWDFGDLTPPSTLPSPVHVFPATGTYTVKLTVTNNTTGCIDSKSYDLQIGTPDAAFTSDKTEGCFTLDIQFTDNSSFATGWLWNFGDGGTSTQQNPLHAYADTGKYTVTLTINPGANCTDSIKKIDYITVYGIHGEVIPSPYQGCTPLTVYFSDNSVSYMGTIQTHDWDFGTGATSTATTPSYTYTAAGSLYASLITTDSHGCSDFSARGIIIKDVIADFTTDTIACPGEEISFTNMTLNGVSYVWYFGDGDSSISANPKHTYSTAGNYSVTLTTIGFGGCTHSVTKNSIIEVESPVADFYTNTTFAPCPPFPVQFYNTTNRSDLNWMWYFGDGGTSTAKDPLHVYFFPGDYDVTLIAWNSSGCRDSITYVGLIKVRGPIGNFTVSTDSGCMPLTVTYNSSVQSTVSIISDLGDGLAYADSLHITHTYATAGNYYPVFTLTDALGCRVSYPVDTIVVGLIPYPNLPPDTTVCRGNYVQFDLPLGDHFLWTANTSPSYLTCDTCKSTVSSARDTITYTVTARTNIGCVATDVITVNVDALPQIFPGLHFRICPSDTLQLTAGPNVASAVWEPFQYMNNSNIVNPLVWPPDSMTYRVTGFNSTGCSISRIVKVWTIDKVMADIGANDTMKCEGGIVPLDVNVLESSFNDTSFQWIPSRYLSSSTIKNPVLNAPAGDYTYKVIVRSSTCEADTETVHITFSPNPEVEAGDDQLVAEGTTVQLWASSRDQVNYSWIPVVDSLSCTDCRKPSLTATKEQTIPVIVTTQFGCVDTAYVKIRVVACDDKMVFVPNTFTPNNDDLNDRLYVRGGGLRTLEYFRVFDRWGKMVWETRNLNEGWDGTVNGKKSDLATYVYLLKGECSSGAEVQKSGNVTLVR